MRFIKNKIISEDLSYIVNNLDIEYFRNTKILITGINGMLAKYLAYSLLSISDIYNIKILGTVRSESDFKNNQREIYDHPNCKILELELNDLTKLIEYDVDIIIHSASKASPKYYKLDPVGTSYTNVIGTYNLLEFSRSQNLKKFIFFSSGEVYGELNNTTDVSEHIGGFVNQLDLRSCYAESKRMGENLCISYLEQYQIPTCIIRPFHTFGPGIKLDDGRIFADILNSLVSKKDIYLFSDGLAKRSFCYISDATIAFFRIISRGKIGEAYNVANVNNTNTIIELSELILGQFPELKLKVHTNVNNQNYLRSQTMNSKINVSKIIELGWAPKIGMVEAFMRTYKSILN